MELKDINWSLITEVHLAIYLLRAQDTRTTTF
jgi:hypothetical protein